MGYPTRAGRLLFYTVVQLREKFRVPRAHTQRVLLELRKDCEVAAPGKLRTLKEIDAADCRVLSDAVASMADAFVTGDAAIVRLGHVDAMRVFTPRQLWDALRNPEG